MRIYINTLSSDEIQDLLRDGLVYVRFKQEENRCGYCEYVAYVYDSRHDTLREIIASPSAADLYDYLGLTEQQTRSIIFTHEPV